MNDKVKKFIEENINLIEYDQWNEVISKLVNYADGLNQYDIEDAFDIFRELDIDVLMYLNYVPPYYYQNNSEIRNIKLSTTICNIRDGAFRNSSIKSINLDNIKSIDNHAFENCIGLSNVGKMIKCGGIYNQAFKGCINLPSIYLTTELKYITTEAFAECGSIDIIYDGTKSDWKKIYIDAKAFRNTNYIIHCKDGDIMKGKR